MSLTLPLIFGGIAAIAVVIRGAFWVIARRRAPRLYVRYDPEHTGDVRPDGLRDWRWFHVVVQNVGGGVVEDCRGYVDGVYERNSGGVFELVPQWVGRLAMHWANQAFALSIDVSARSTPPWDRVDVVRVPDTGGHFHLASPNTKSGLPVQFGPGTYRILVTVESATAPHAQVLLQVDFDGNWETIDVRGVPLELIN